jgi:hypothetical protein
MKFIIRRNVDPQCVSLRSGETSSASDTSLTSILSWILRIDGDENTDSRIGDGSIVNIEAGEGISLLKEGNTLTIASTVEPASATAGEIGDDMTTASGFWTLTAPFAKIGTPITIEGGDTLRMKGSGATSVSTNGATKEVTISSPVYDWILGTGSIKSLSQFSVEDGDYVKITGGGGTTVSIDRAEKKVTISSPEVPNVKEYQYRTVSAWCQDRGNNNFWLVEHEDTGIDVSCTDSGGRGSLFARCTAGKIINYGGYCQSDGSNRNAIQYLGPTGDFSSGEGYSRGWSNEPTISEVRMLCREDRTVLMHVWVTCMREKP